MLEHGGRLRQAAQRYGISLDEWLDLSTGINPVGYPVPAIDSECWRRLPEDDDELEAAARAYYRAPDALALHGSQAAIQLLPKLFSPQQVAVLHPSYNEHAAAWRRGGHSVQLFNASELDKVTAECNVVVIIHPNNPTGECFGLEQLQCVAATLAARDGLLVIDEAFMDTTPEHSLAAHTNQPGLVVLRSLGKFFGLAGARVGFALGDANVLRKLRESAGPWAVAGPSRAVATAALRDVDWQTETRLRLVRDGTRLAQLLRCADLGESHGTALFQWLPHTRANAIFESLAQEGILVRLFSAPPALRFGLPGTEHEWLRLQAALDKITKKIW